APPTGSLPEIPPKRTEPVAGLRVYVQKGGCSGYSYGMSLAPQVEEGDWVGEFGGVKVMVDQESAKVLEGVQIDYVESLQGSGFSIQNPNAVRSCGCGNSFETAENTEAAGGETQGGGWGRHRWSEPQ